MRYTIPFACAMLAAPASAHDISVVTDIPVTQSLVSMVLGDHGEAELILDRGADAHSFQLRPSQATALSEAGLVFWVGAEMAPWMARALDGPGAGAEAVTLLEADGLRLREFADDGGQDHGHEDDHGDDDHDHDHGADDHAHDEHDHDHGAEDHAHDDHDHGDHDDDHAGHDRDEAGLDPHAWLDTRNARVWLDVIADALAAHQPAHADAFRANADAAQERIALLSAELDDMLAPARDMPFVTFHDAYGYFTRQFELTQAGSIALGHAATPGAQRLAALRETLREDNVACVFPEANHDPALVDTVLDGTDARRGAALDPAGTVMAPGPDLYPQLMRRMAGAIADCAARS